ncbi:MAG: response regulator [Thermodesulfobacteriota bacterium]
MTTPLQHFRQKGLVEQIQSLEDVKKLPAAEILPELYDLFIHRLKDSTIDYMVGMTLREILGSNEEAAVTGLRHDHPEIRRLCIQICGQKCFEKAIPLLSELMSRQPEDSLRRELLVAMSQLQSNEFLKIFKEHMDCPQEDLAALAIETAGRYNDPDVIAKLMALLDDGETDERYMACDIRTGAAIEALGRMADKRVLGYLVSKLHYRNPTGRLMVHRALTSHGAAVIPFLGNIFEGDDVDAKIMAANIIGMIGEKSGGELLIQAADRGLLNNPNVKYAAYEAFGRIPFMKGIVFLMDGLSETDPLILTAVLASMENQVNPGVIKKIQEKILQDETTRELLVQAIVRSKSMKIFEQLYADARLAPVLINGIRTIKEPSIIAAFRQKLSEMPQETALRDAEALSTVSSTRFDRKILASDDSKAMLAFYRTTIAAMGFEVVTTENGREAMDKIHGGDEFVMILTDMNMPVMDGIEFTRQARSHEGSRQTPIIMITTESESSQVKLAGHAGVNGFLTKPFTADQLRAKIAEYIRITE